MFSFRRRPRGEVDAEGFVTPLEAAAQRAVWHEIFKSTKVPRASAIKRYVRTDIAPNVAHFSAHAGARTLVVGFCGKKLRLLMPVAMMLQSLDDRRFDALVLADPQRLHFDQGIPGFAQSLPDIARRIAAIVEENGYDSVITYGTSMGGFPALRMGSLIGAARAVSCGGRPVNHMERLGRGTRPVGAFDLICDCRMPLRAPSYVLFSRDRRPDARAAGMISKIAPEVHLGPVPHDGHNFPFRIFQNGNLDEYFSRIFDLDREPDLARIAALAS